MTKSNPKLILNLDIKDEELEKRIEIALDDYIEKNVNHIIDDKIEEVLTKRIEQYFSAEGEKYNTWRRDKFIGDITKRADNIINQIIDERVAIKVSQRLSKLLDDKLKDQNDE